MSTSPRPCSMRLDSGSRLSPQLPHSPTDTTSTFTVDGSTFSGATRLAMEFKKAGLFGSIFSQSGVHTFNVRLIALAVGLETGGRVKPGVVGAIVGPFAGSFVFLSFLLSFFFINLVGDEVSFFFFIDFSSFFFLLSFG